MEVKWELLENFNGNLKMKIEDNLFELDGVVARSKAMLDAIAWGFVYGRSSDLICVVGESGVGKELLFKTIAKASGKTNIVSVNCGAMSDGILESELFGHRKGSFTDAVSDRKGAFTQASKGVLFLDEIGEMSLRGQVKLLRALEYREVKAVGSDDVSRHDAKVVLATNRDLKIMVKEEKFRKDLYFRIEGFTIEIPPLRDRVEDIEPMARFFAGKEYRFSKGAVEGLKRYNWPGNVRELKNAIERARVRSLYGEKEIQWDMFGLDKTPNFEMTPTMKIRDMEKQLINDAFIRFNQNISKTSRALGIPRTTLWAKLRKYNIID